MPRATATRKKTAAAMLVSWVNSWLKALRNGMPARRSARSPVLPEHDGHRDDEDARGNADADRDPAAHGAAIRPRREAAARRARAGGRADSARLPARAPAKHPRRARRMPADQMIDTALNPSVVLGSSGSAARPRRIMKAHDSGLQAHAAVDQGPPRGV